MDPLLQVSQKGARFGDIIGEMGVRATLVAVMLLALVAASERQQTRMALSS